MSKIPTAEEFLKNSNATGMAFNREAIQETMIEFAKLHRKAIIDAILEKAEIEERFNGCRTCGACGVRDNSILDAYPETLIK